MSGHRGSCHCGAIAFAIDYPITELTTCDCSLCVIRNAMMAKVPEAALTLLRGEEALATYQWNTGRARHHFCRHCGTYVFHRKRAAPDHFGVNAFAIEGLDIASLPVRATQGANMTVREDGARDRWPGPRVAD